MNIESGLWKLVQLNGAYVQVTQRASGVTRTISRSHLPSDEVLAMAHERTFDKYCREAFHGER